MEMELNSLIEKIKRDGISEAKKQQEEILKEAQEAKRKIIKEAQDQAESILKSAKEQAYKLLDNSKEAIAQAVRDATLSLKDKIQNTFDAILKQEIEDSLTNEFISELIIKLAKDWQNKKETDIEVLVGQKDREKIKKLVLSRFKKQFSSKINFKVNPNINKGIYIGIKGEDVYYDFTDEAILEILKEYLRPFITEIIEKKKHG